MRLSSSTDSTHWLYGDFDDEGHRAFWDADMGVLVFPQVELSLLEGVKAATA